MAKKYEEILRRCSIINSNMGNAMFSDAYIDITEKIANNADTLTAEEIDALYDKVIKLSTTIQPWCIYSDKYITADEIALCMMPILSSCKNISESTLQKMFDFAKPSALFRGFTNTLLYRELSDEFIDNNIHDLYKYIENMFSVDGARVQQDKYEAMNQHILYKAATYMINNHSVISPTAINLLNVLDDKHPDFKTFKKHLLTLGLDNSDFTEDTYMQSYVRRCCVSVLTNKKFSDETKNEFFFSPFLDLPVVGLQYYTSKMCEYIYDDAFFDKGINYKKGATGSEGFGEYCALEEMMKSGNISPAIEKDISYRICDLIDKKPPVNLMDAIHSNLIVYFRDIDNIKQIYNYMSAPSLVNTSFLYNIDYAMKHGITHEQAKERAEIFINKFKGRNISKANSSFLNLVNVASDFIVLPTSYYEFLANVVPDKNTKDNLAKSIESCKEKIAFNENTPQEYLDILKIQSPSLYILVKTNEFFRDNKITDEKTKHTVVNTINNLFKGTKMPYMLTKTFPVGNVLADTLKYITDEYKNEKAELSFKFSKNLLCEFNKLQNLKKCDGNSVEYYRQYDLESLASVFAATSRSYQYNAHLQESRNAVELAKFICENVDYVNASVELTREALAMKDDTKNFYI